MNGSEKKEENRSVTTRPMENQRNAAQRAERQSGTEQERGRERSECDERETVEGGNAKGESRRTDRVRGMWGGMRRLHT